MLSEFDSFPGWFWFLVYFYNKPTSTEKILDQNGPYINTFQTNVCLSVILEFCLLSSSSASSLRPPPAYVEAWNIYQKLVYYLSWSSTKLIFDLPDHLSGQFGNTAICIWKTKSQKWHFLGIFIHYYWTFMFVLLYLHQTFTDY